MMHFWGYGYPFGIGGILMIVPMVLFWGLIITGIVLAVRALSGNRQIAVTPGRPRALDILEERYAKGEIDTEEYQARKRELTS